MLLFLLFLHCHSLFSSSSSISLFLSSTSSSVPFLPFSGRRHKMTHQGWRVVKQQLNNKFDISNHPQNFGWVMALFFDILLVCWYFAGMHWFYWKFAEGYIIVKYRSSLILVIIRKTLAKLWPFFDLDFVVGVKYKVKILFNLNNVWRDALISFEVCSEGLPLGIGAIIKTSVFVVYLFIFFFFVSILIWFISCKIMINAMILILRL